MASSATSGMSNQELKEHIRLLKEAIALEAQWRTINSANGKTMHSGLGTAQRLAGLNIPEFSNIPFKGMRGQGIKASDLLDQLGITRQQRIDLNNARMDNLDHRRLSVDKGAQVELERRVNAFNQAQSRSMFGSHMSHRAEDRAQYQRGQHFLRMEADYLNNPPPTFAQALNRTVFSARSANMMGQLAQGNMMPAVETAATWGVQGAKALYQGVLTPGWQALHAALSSASSGGGGGGGGGGNGSGNNALPGDMENGGPGNPDPSALGKLPGVGSLIDLVKGKLAGAGAALMAVAPEVTLPLAILGGTAAAFTGSALLSRSQNANAANYRNGLGASISNLGGKGNASGQNAWDVAINTGESYMYDPNTSYNVARTLGESGVQGLNGARGVGAAMQTTMNFARQFNMDPQQLSQVTGNLMRNHDTTADAVDKMFQLIAKGAKNSTVPVAKLVDSLKSLTETSNGSTQSVNGIAALVKDQNILGAGANVGAGFGGMTGNTGYSAIVGAAMLTNGDVAKYNSETSKGVGNSMNLVRDYINRHNPGKGALGDAALIGQIQNIPGVDVSTWSRQAQLDFIHKSEAGQDWTSTVGKHELASYADSSAAGKKLALTLTTPMDQAMVHVQAAMDKLANHGFPDLGSSVLETAKKVLKGGGDMLAGFENFVGTLGGLVPQMTQMVIGFESAFAGNGSGGSYNIGGRGGAWQPGGQAPGGGALPPAANVTPKGDLNSGWVGQAQAIAKQTGMPWQAAYAWLQGEGADPSLNNPTNIMYVGQKGATGSGVFTKDGQLAKFATPAAGAAAVNSTLNNGYYGNVLKTIPSGDSMAILKAIEKSPWSAQHYGGNGLEQIFGQDFRVTVTVQDTNGNILPHQATPQKIKTPKGARTNGPPLIHGRNM